MSDTSRRIEPYLARLYRFGFSLAGEDEWQGLPPGEGREDVFAICGACHSLLLVMQQGLSRAVWDEAIDWMVAEQEMAELEPDERRRILDYLSASTGSTGRREPCAGRAWPVAGQLPNTQKAAQCGLGRASSVCGG